MTFDKGLDIVIAVCKKVLGPSWKTSLCGGLAVAGAALATEADNETIVQAGKVIAIIFGALAARAMRDNSKTSEQAGAKRAPRRFQ